MKTGRGEDGDGPKGWPGAQRAYPGIGAWFERPPPVLSLSAPPVASERYVEPLQGGAAAGSAAEPLRH